MDMESVLHVWLLYDGALRRGLVESKQELVRLRVAEAHTLEALDLFELASQVELIVAHRRPQEPLVVEIVEHCLLDECPVLGVWVEFVLAFPDLELLVEDPQAVVLHVV